MKELDVCAPCLSVLLNTTACLLAGWGRFPFLAAGNTSLIDSLGDCSLMWGHTPAPRDDNLRVNKKRIASLLIAVGRFRLWMRVPAYMIVISRCFRICAIASKSFPAMVFHRSA